ncbi:hypothetical protein GPJ56_007242 [Histomonas meleagridis]|nr:hypothetical protein GPJ56_007242 [Histomonas meleagridis]
MHWVATTGCHHWVPHTWVATLGATHLGLHTGCHTPPGVPPARATRAWCHTLGATTSTGCHHLGATHWSATTGCHHTLGATHLGLPLSATHWVPALCPHTGCHCLSHHTCTLGCHMHTCHWVPPLGATHQVPRTERHAHLVPAHWVARTPGCLHLVASLHWVLATWSHLLPVHTGLPASLRAPGATAPGRHTRSCHAWVPHTSPPPGCHHACGLHAGSATTASGLLPPRVLHCAGSHCTGCHTHKVPPATWASTHWVPPHWIHTPACHTLVHTSTCRLHHTAALHTWVPRLSATA